MVSLHPVGSHRGTAPFIAWHPLSCCQQKEAQVQVGVVKISPYFIGNDLELSYFCIFLTKHILVQIGLLKDPQFDIWLLNQSRGLATWFSRASGNEAPTSGST